MSDEIEVKMYRSPSDMKSTLAVTIQDSLCEATIYAVLHLVAEKIADRYVEEHYAEIVAKLDQQAIANLAIADSGKKIAEEIHTRPTVLREPGARTTVNKFSLF